MPKRGPRFTQEEKLAILKDGEKNGVKAVCAKYGVSDQTYRAWRYQASGIQPRKQFSTQEKLRILEEGYQNGIERVAPLIGSVPEPIIGGRGNSAYQIAAADWETKTL